MPTMIEVPFFCDQHVLRFAPDVPCFEETIRPVVDRVLMVADGALAKARIEPGSIRGILLVGGSCQIPFVRDQLRQRYGRRLHTTPSDLMWVVAMGAAAHHRDLMKHPTRALKPRLGCDLYVRTYDQGKLTEALLASADQQLPLVKYEREFALNAGARAVTIELLTEAGSGGGLVPLARRDIGINVAHVRTIQLRVDIDASRLIAVSVANPRTRAPIDAKIEVRGDVAGSDADLAALAAEYGFAAPPLPRGTGSQRLAVGIDLGTTTSEVAVWHGSRPCPEKVGQPLHSTVWVSGASKPETGVPAYSVHRKEEGFFAHFKVDIGRGGGGKYSAGGRDWPPCILAAYVLRELWDRVTAAHGKGGYLEEAVITVPHDFTEDQRREVTVAARLAGIAVPVLQNEPEAAFAYYSEVEDKTLGTDSRQTYMVVDFGGGTTDVSVVHLDEHRRRSVVAGLGDTRLGGNDLTSAIAERALEDFLRTHDMTLDAKARDRYLFELWPRADRFKEAFALSMLSD